MWGVRTTNRMRLWGTRHTTLIPRARVFEYSSNVWRREVTEKATEVCYFDFPPNQPKDRVAEGSGSGSGRGIIIIMATHRSSGCRHLHRCVPCNCLREYTLSLVIFRALMPPYREAAIICADIYLSVCRISASLPASYLWILCLVMMIRSGITHSMLI